MWWVSSLDQTLYQGACRQGDQAATDEQVQAWLASLVTLDIVQGECQRRIDLAVNLNQKLNLLGTMQATTLDVLLLGQTATDEQKADAGLFIQSMQWITAMKAACAGLVGNVTYDQDVSWPALSAELVAFGARF